jgi:hypothetical protein
MIPVGRSGLDSDVAAAAFYLTSDAADVSLGQDRASSCVEPEDRFFARLARCRRAGLEDAI